MYKSLLFPFKRGPMRIRSRVLLWMMLGLTAAPSALAEDVTTIALKDIQSFPNHAIIAKVIPLNDVTIRSEISAKIVDINTEVGDEARKGQTLVQLDCRAFKLAAQLQNDQYERLNNELKWTTIEFNRSNALYKQNNFPKANLDRIQQGIEQLNIQLKIQRISIQSAKLNVDKCTITSPFTGVITQRLVDEEEFVNPGSPVLQLLEANNSVIEADIPVDSVADFVSASAFWTKDLDKNKVELNLITIIPQVNPSNRTQTMRLTSSKPLLIGDAPLLQWRSTTARLPAKYLQRMGDKLGIWIVKDKGYKFITLPNAQEGRPFDIPALAGETQIVAENAHLIEQ